ncbi:MAG: RagB/SusD family nutrient uptake outer membrane protein [Prevotella sp.]|nr:RagB/SusD family nutrient uptake outer membrane protein [Prevotella sp.]
MLTFLPAGCIALLAATILCACSLDEHPTDQIAEEKAYTTATSLYQNTVATLYNYIGGSEDGQGLQGTCRGVYDLQTFGSDEAILPTRGGDWYDGGLWQAMYKHTWSAGHDLPKNAWLYLYKVIVLSNRSLEKLDEYRHLLTTDEAQAYQAEVRALRAIYYYYLMDLFGRVPLVLSSETPMQQVRQSNRADVCRFIYDELTTALPLLPAENSTQPGDYYGRVTRPVALFVLAKLALNSTVYGCTAIFGSDSPLKACIGYCNQIETLGYRLATNFEDNFAVYNETSPENIWTIPMDKNLYRNQQQNLYRSYHYRHAAAYGFTAENGSCATRSALDIFGYATDQQDSRFDKSYYAGIVYDLNGNVVVDRTGQPLAYVPEAADIDLSGSPYVEVAGARMKKYAVDKNAPKDGKLMDNDIVLFRYADVLLMRAEAALADGDATSAQADLDLIRQRAGMPAIPATLKNILDERLRELAWEGWRRQDQIRAGHYRSLYTGADAIDESDGHTSVFPIPADVMALNTNLQQNPGY